MMAELCLGTVQFGLEYGVTNEVGQVSFESAQDIVRVATDNGINLFDTAAAYGTSESILGSILSDGDGNRIVTKTATFDDRDVITKQDAQRLIERFTASCEALGRDKLYGILVHHGRDLAKPDGEILIEALLQLKAEERVEKIGASVYTSEEIDSILEHFSPDILQVPLSVADQRLVRNGYLNEMHSKGIEIHARSIFLQGLLLQPIEHLPDFLGPVMSYFQAFDAVFGDTGKLAACMSFIRSLPEVTAAVVGVTKSEELAEIVSAHGSTTHAAQDYREYAIEDSFYLHPGNWTQN